MQGSESGMPIVIGIGCTLLLILGLVWLIFHKRRDHFK